MSIIEQRSIAQQVYDHIKHQILSGQLRGGDRVREEEIAARLLVSRTPVREALKRLDAYGLLKYRNRSYVEVVTLDGVDEARKVATVRSNLESLAARLAAQRATAEDCDRLFRLTDECEQAAQSGDLADVFEADSRLHMEIALRSGNEHLYDLMERLDARVQLCRMSGCATQEKVRHDVSNHRGIVEAICNGDPERAEALMAEHAMRMALVGSSTNEARDRDRR